MKFVGDNYGLLWSHGQVETIYIECKKHNVYSEISNLHNFRPEEMARLEQVPLTVKIKCEDEEVSLDEMNFQQLDHDWIRHDLGKFLQPPDPAPTVWLTFFGDAVSLEMEISDPAFDHLHQELHGKRPVCPA